MTPNQQNLRLIILDFIPISRDLYTTTVVSRLKVKLRNIRSSVKLIVEIDYTLIVKGRSKSLCFLRLLKSESRLYF